MSGYAANSNFTGVQPEPKRQRLSPPKIQTFPCIFNLQPGQELFTIGDVHGDLLAMLSALRLTGCVNIPDNVLQKVHICHEGNNNSSRIGFPLTREEMASIQWRPGCRHVVAFLGDVLDNRRRSEDIFGVCAMTGTQTQMLDLLDQLRQQALPQGGCVIFILGNHDVANMTRDVDLGLLMNGCTDYAPRFHSRIRTTTGQQREYNTCHIDENGQVTEQFSQEHVNHMLEKIHPLNPVAVARVNFSNADPQSSVLLVHGGLDHRAFLPNVHPGNAVANLRFINQVYTEALFRQVADAQNILKSIGERAPTWCRPSFLGMTKGDQFWQSSPEELMTFFGAPSMIKAHDRQSQQQIRCTSTQSRAYSRPDGWAGRGVPSSDDTVMSPGDLCFIDVGMSRAFGPSRRYQVLRLYMDHHSGTLRRQVVK